MDGRTWFDTAAQGGNAEMVSGLLERGALPDVNVVSAADRRSALYRATAERPRERGDALWWWPGQT